MITRFKRTLRPRVLLLSVFLLILLIASCVPGTTVPRGWSGGAIADGTLFIGSMDGKVVAVNASDGKRIWEAPLETTASPSGGVGCAPPATPVAIYGAPAVSDNLVYIGGYNGKFSAFAEGKLRWVYPRDRALVNSTGRVAPIVGGAVVAQGKVFFGAANGLVYALDATTGDFVWEFPTADKVWSTPAFHDGTLFIGSFDKKLYAVDAATGEQKWVFETQGAIVATPLVHDSTVFIGSFDRNFYALDAATGHEKWRFSEAKNWFWAKPLVKDNIIYASNLDGKVYVLAAQDGQKLAAIDLGGAVSSAPVMADNLIIITTESGVVYALNTGNNDKRQLRDLAEKVDAPLATEGEVVYIHTGAGKLYAVNAQAGGELWQISLKTPPPTPQPGGGGTNWALLIFTAVGVIFLFWVLRRSSSRASPN